MCETTSAYAARLREKARECEFGDTFDERVLKHIIQTIENKKLIEKTITEASQTEDIARQIQNMRSGLRTADDVSRVYSEPPKKRQPAKRPVQSWKCDFS